MTSFRTVTIGSLSLANDRPIALIAGPCQLESRQHALEMSRALKELCDGLGIGLIYKTSFDKANRSSVNTARGLGLERSLPILAEVRETVGVPVLTDVHEPDQCAPVAEAVDVLQIPAFLCRQTDLLLAAGRTGKPINVKKGQFLAPWDMKNVVAKIDSTGNRNTLVCERGVSFGYNTLVSDMRALPVLAQTGCPVVFGRSGDHQRRPARVRAGAGAGGGRDRGRRRVHGDPPGPRQGAQRRAEHGAAQGHARAGALADRVRPPSQGPAASDILTPATPVLRCLFFRHARA
jgi:2-dehydro-3-deoxyphosphooctonate aldolase (KDO 8-P synthase)